MSSRLDKMSSILNKICVQPVGFLSNKANFSDFFRKFNESYGNILPNKLYKTYLIGQNETSIHMKKKQVLADAKIVEFMLFCCILAHIKIGDFCAIVCL